jgi:hypothetical protein
MSLLALPLAANAQNGSGLWDNQAGSGYTHIFSSTVYNDFRLAVQDSHRVSLKGTVFVSPALIPPA